jgi:hypothetical protein
LHGFLGGGPIPGRGRRGIREVIVPLGTKVYIIKIPMAGIVVIGTEPNPEILVICITG